jgi:hypothetical protein
MQDTGLYMVYMGLESGSESSLVTLHKQIDVAQNENETLMQVVDDLSRFAATAPNRRSRRKS